MEEKAETHTHLRPLLSYEDSNLDKQNQNLLCYHYTIRQSRLWLPLGSDCKINGFVLSGNQQIVVFLATLQNNVSVVNQIG